VSHIYPSKLLLFGEYTVLSGSQALAVPLKQWKGEWKQSEDGLTARGSALFSYVDWLKSKDIISSATSAHIINDAEEGWHYEADIPIGYGLGSSGAYVAAIYDRYIIKENSVTDSATLEMLSKMEGFFHGSSSGMDPMVSYTGEALYKNEIDTFQSIVDPGWPEGFQVYLLDSGIGRATGPLVQLYKEALKQSTFELRIKRELIPMVDHAIHFYLADSGPMLEECIQVISQFQRLHFSKLIPSSIQKQWDSLIKIPGVYLKFCGAGGGGYFLVISCRNEIIPGTEELIQIY
jgi:mevalonate kinase